ncbi:MULTISPECIES: HdaA/DnaA family protein [unclassified Rickettsia]|uniref:HdaA/DnaA family protein n=1 Tax=unclassified Rickettsia TaxID=114295 RepID=UPI0020A11E62|nr:DnaA/Hda family protein [Rickettsia endosymbiont of Ceutorhynchus assimilis]
MQQLIFPLSYNTQYHPDEFIVSNSNKLAHNALKNWQTNWGVNPYKFTLLIKGAPASGKTYLAKIWQNLANSFIIKDIFFDEEILAKYNSFIIEDIENWQEVILLHLFNLINERQKYLLLTGKINKNFILPDLSSRVKSVLTIEIEPPDDELMRILIFKHFATSSITIPESVVDFLLVNLPRQHKEIIEILEQINHFALTSKRKVTIPLVKEVLNLQNI